MSSMTITKNTLAVITLLILILTTISSCIAYTVGVKSNLDHISNELTDVQQNLKELHPRVNKNEIDIAVIEEHYANIDKNIEEIKNTLNGK